MAHGSSSPLPVRGRPSRPWPAIAVAFLAAFAAAAPALSHDLFFRAPRYHLAPGAAAVVDVLSGTFTKSENAIERERLADLSIVTPEGRVKLDLAAWSESEPKSTLRLTAGGEGTYVIGAAVKPRMLSLSGKEFGAYLREEGLEEVLQARAAEKRLDEPSRERYSKYLKALVQVGAAASDAHATVLGYAAEIVPEENPYRLKAGGTLTVRCLVDGKPYAGKKVFAGGRRGTSDVRLAAQPLVTDSEGRAKVRLPEAGVYYVKLVAIAELKDDAEANYESKWSTLSFAVGLGRPSPAP
jgi:uncharacterized GH25 family protein